MKVSRNSKVLLHWEKGWGATSMYQLLEFQFYHDPIPLPLLLVPSALEQLWETHYFTKLHLWSTYNLIQIKEGNKWKTAFHTTRGHYKYLVIPYCLTNALAIFGAFMNKIFRDLLNSYVTVYTDDIVFYSKTYALHITHVLTVLTWLLQHQLVDNAESVNSIKTPSPS